MMTRVLAHELHGEPVRIEELVVDGPVRTRDSEPVAEEDWITADQIGEVVASLVRDEPPAWPAMRRKGPLIIMDPLKRAPAELAPDGYTR